MQTALGELSHLGDVEKGASISPEEPSTLVSLYRYRLGKKDLPEIQKKAQSRPEALPSFHECLLHVCYDGGKKN